MIRPFEALLILSVIGFVTCVALVIYLSYLYFNFLIGLQASWRNWTAQGISTPKVTGSSPVEAAKFLNVKVSQMTKEQEFQMIYDCFKSGQMTPDQFMKHLEETEFATWYWQNKTNKEYEE